MSNISATIDGEARLVEQGSEEEGWCKERHLENHNFSSSGSGGGSLDGGGERRGGGWGGMVPRQQQQQGDGGTSCFIQGEEVRVVVVEVRRGRIADWKGGVKDWSLVSEGEGERGREGGVNGID